MSTNPISRSRSAVHVEKLHLPARVSQPNLCPRDGSFLLAPAPDDAARPETLLELLNSTRVVVPFILAEDSTVLLLTRVNIDWVAVGPRVDRALVHPPDRPVNREQRVDLRLIDESRVHAVLQWDSREGTIRLSDFLNEDSGFMLARTAIGLLLINRLRVRETHLAESTARPVSDDDATVQEAA